ncbi:MAG: LysR family transcriptional regulator [Rhizobiales bacterium]|nr:LysR family transcriptional regulator [Hyphomicrobiales bacterium]
MRTLIAVIDLRSFTKAAQSLKVTQPAVSAQIKRLQLLLGTELLDKSAPGVTLTPTGELVINYARRLLSINDQIIHLAEPTPPSQTLRIGVPGDFVGPDLPLILSEFRSRWPDVRFHVRCGGTELQFKALEQGENDLVVHLSPARPVNALHHWVEETAWVRGPHLKLDTTAPVPLVTYGPACVYHRIAVEALDHAGLAYDTVFRAASIATLAAAINAGLGVMVTTRSRVRPSEMTIWDNGPLPRLPHLHCGIFVAEGGDRETREQLADAIASILRPRHESEPAGMTAKASSAAH